MKTKRPVLFKDYVMPPPDKNAKSAGIAAILKTLRPVVRQTSLWGQVKAQLSYMGAWFWLGLCALLAVFFLVYWQIQFAAGQYSVAALLPTLLLYGVTGPVLAALAAPVVARSHSFDMWELEEAAFHNLARLTMLRLGIMLAAALPAMLGLALLGSNVTGFVPALFALVVPFLLVSGGNYFVLGRLRGTAGSLCCVGLSGMLVFCVFILFSQAPFLCARLERTDAIGLGFALLAVALLVFCLGAKSLIRSTV